MKEDLTALGKVSALSDQLSTLTSVSGECGRVYILESHYSRQQNNYYSKTHWFLYCDLKRENG